MIQTGQAQIRNKAPRRENIASDLIAALTFAVVNIPQALATTLLAAVNPVFGLYTLMIAMPMAAVFTSSVYMNVSTTSALAVATGDAVGFIPEPNRAQALMVLVLLIGIIQVLFGVFRLGALMRFVSHSVMVGFTSGIAALIILGQVEALTGYDSIFSNRILQLADVILNLGQIDIPTVVIGVSTMALIFLLDRTPLAKGSYIIALIIPTAAVALLNLDSVAILADITSIPRSLPSPQLSDFRFVPVVFGSAVAIAIIGLVQGAGVSQTYPNPNGKYPNVSRDFLGQGVANVVTSFFQGIPGGGSLSGTSLMVNSGQQTRWANVFAGISVAIGVLLFGRAIELLPMSALGGLLIVIGIRTFNPEAIQTVWHTNQIARAAMVITFVATLFLPLQSAVMAGIAVSALMYVVRQSNRVRVVQYFWDDQTFPIEETPVKQLSGNEITALNVYGSLFFAGASAFENQLPEVGDAKRAVVLIGFRGRQDLGSTLITVLQRYAKQLQANQGKLLLVGINDTIRNQLERTGTLAQIGPENVYAATDRLGEAMNNALKDAHAWLENQS